MTYYVTAVKQVKSHLKLRLGYNGMKTKRAISLFAELYGYSIEGDMKKWLVELYMSRTDEFIKRVDSAFYGCREWVTLRNKVIAHYGKVCMKCKSIEDIVVDHIKPRSKYPEFELDFNNMQVLCNMCNLRKSNKHEKDYRN